jgi:hypothetical protein
MKVRGFVLSVLVFAAPGCYAYLETPMDAVPPGADVRVQVTRETADRLRDALAADQRSIHGRVRELVDDGVLLEVTTVTRQTGFRFEPLRQTVRLQPADATSVELKTLDRGRTISALVLVSVTAGAIAWKALGGRTGGKDSPQDPNQPSDARVVSVSFGFPFR